MPHIKIISDDDATGPLARLYDAAKKRAGKIFNIVRIMGLAPKSLQASMGLYGAVMFNESELSRALRELLAVVVSRTNDCFY